MLVRVAVKRRLTVGFRMEEVNRQKLDLSMLDRYLEAGVACRHCPTGQVAP